MTESVLHFYVDEAGDLTLVGRRGKPLLGTDGVSKTFMVGMARIADPDRLATDLEALRHELLSDLYLNRIPSMQMEAGKTAKAFHAKDDCAEVRMRVFKLLVNHDIKVKVGIRRKSALIEELQGHCGIQRRAFENMVYDQIVATLFKDQLHKADQNIIVFARRGKASRQLALEAAIDRARSRWEKKTGIAPDKHVAIQTAVPSDEAGLQAVDYFLWALQRLFERGDDRYFQFVRDHFGLIMDFDDRRTGKPYGRWYKERDPLTKEKMLPITG